jgi:hypothetical protein
MTLFEVLSTLIVLATPPPGDVTPAGAPAASASPGAAEVLFQGGVKAYDAREYGVARELFERAYTLSRIPEILYDIGLTYRALGECERALASFDTFLKVAPPGHPLLIKARARMEDLSSCGGSVAEVPAAVPPPAKLALASPERTSPAADARVGRSPPVVTTTSVSSGPLAAPRVVRGAQWSAAALAGGSLALGLSGAAFGIKAHDLAETVAQTRVWDQETQQADAQGRTYDRAATVLLVSAATGALLAAATYGVSLWWASHSTRAP